MSKEIKKVENNDISLVKVLDPVLEEKLKLIKRKMAAKQQQISDKKTIHRSKPRPIGGGKTERYLEASYMYSLMNEHFPGWSIEPCNKSTSIRLKDCVFTIAEVVITWIDIELFHYQIESGIPADRAIFVRKSYALGGGVTFLNEESDRPVHASNGVKKAVTEAVKYAINRGTGIGNDTYGREDGVSFSMDEIKTVLSKIDNDPVLTEELKNKFKFDFLLNVEKETAKAFFDQIKKAKEEIQNNLNKGE